MDENAILAVLIFAAAMLYASVGNAGGSGYLAAMGLMNVPSEVMKPAALLLNVVVATIATSRFHRAGAISWPMLWPFVIGSVPMAFVGGAIYLPSRIYHPAVGAILLATGVRMLYAAYVREAPAARNVSREMAVLAGAGIGLIAGLTGTGGGILLAPLLLTMGWATIREAVGVAAAFILLNSLAALVGNLASVQYLPPEIGIWAVAAAAGGFLGAQLGSRYLAPRTLSYLLAAVLIAAGIKMLLELW